jgi:hypothetical protein
MSLTAPQERPQRHRPREGEQPAARPAHELKYRHDAAHYVADMLTELRQIAGKAGFEKLVAAVDAAYYEAYAVLGSNGQSGPAEVREKTSSPMEQTRG